MEDFERAELRTAAAGRGAAVPKNPTTRTWTSRPASHDGRRTDSIAIAAKSYSAPLPTIGVNMTRPCSSIKDEASTSSSAGGAGSTAGAREALSPLMLRHRY